MFARISAYLSVITIFLGLQIPGTAIAALTNLQLQATFESVAVSAEFSGSDSRAFIEFRPAGASAWLRGVDMVRPILKPVTNPTTPPQALANRWVGSIFYLQSGQSYDVRISAFDSSGTQTGTIQGSVTTLSTVWPVNAGRDYFVSTSGNDANPGSSASPLRTIARAYTLATAGDTIRILPGTYYERIYITKSGQANRPISFVGEGSGVIIDGSDPVSRRSWSSFGSGVYYIALNYDPLLVVADGSKRMFKHASLAELQNGTAWSNDFWNTAPITSGVYYSSAEQRLYIKLGDSSNPSNHDINIHRSVATQGDAYGLYIYNSSWINVENINFQFSHYGMRIKSDNSASTASYLRVKNSRFRYFNRGIQATGNVQFSLFEDNTFTDSDISSWPWYAHKVFPNETSAIDLVVDNNSYNGHSNVVRRNVSDGPANGICVHSKNTDVHNNTIRNVADDAWEPDTAYGASNSDIYVTENLRFFDNKIEDTFSVFSLAPIYGVTYIFGNTVKRFKYLGVKNNFEDSYGPVMFWNNTFWNDYQNSTRATRTFNIALTISDYDVRNNIFYNRDWGVYYGSTNISLNRNKFDYNLWQSSGTNFWSLNGSYQSTISGVRSAYGYELNGNRIDPGLTNPAAGDFSLLSSSAAKDSGALIPGFHCDALNKNGANCRRWSGISPDIGAVEAGLSADNVAPAAPAGLNVQ